jgi:hypothetical protein
MSLSVALALVALLQSPTGEIPRGAALTEAISANDAAFFELFFGGCDPAQLATMVTDDFEFFDDRGGRVATDAASFVAQYRTQCEARQAPDSWRSRRELAPGTLGVYPINGYGAVETGEHYFYERRGEGPETRVGRARFSQMWKLEGSRWKLARVFSYDHAAAE